MTGATVARMRYALSRRPDAQRLLHRLGDMAGFNGLTVRVSAKTARAWWSGDSKTICEVERQADAVARRYGVTVEIVAPNGVRLYRTGDAAQGLAS